MKTLLSSLMHSYATLVLDEIYIDLGPQENGETSTKQDELQKILKRYTKLDRF